MARPMVTRCWRLRARLFVDGGRCHATPTILKQQLATSSAWCMTCDIGDCVVDVDVETAWQHIYTYSGVRA